MIGAVGRVGLPGLQSGRRGQIRLPDFRYDVSDASSITLAGGTASQINDLGVTASRHLTQSVASQQPVYGTRNGRAALIFDGSNDILLNNTNAGTIGVTDVTFFLVGAFISTFGEDLPLSIGVTGQTRQTRGLWRASGSSQLGFTTTFNDLTAGPPIDAGGASHAWEVAQNGQQILQTRDGINQATYPRTLAAAPLPVSATGISLGSMQGGSAAGFYTNIAVHEVIGFYSFLTEAERLAIRAQLMSKWNL